MLNSSRRLLYNIAAPYTILKGRSNSNVRIRYMDKNIHIYHTLGMEYDSDDDDNVAV